MKIPMLIARNLRILTRSKATLLVVLIAPLLAVLLASMSFDNDTQYALKVAVFGQYMPRQANEFIQDLKMNGFQVDTVNSADECTSLVKGGSYHACMIVDADSKNQVSMTMFIDYSKIQVVDYLLHKVSDRVALQSSQISLNITEAILRRIEASKDEVDKNRFIITSLTTGQEKVGRELDELNAKLAGIDPKVQMDAPRQLAQSLEGNRAVSQLESIQRLKNDLVSRLSDLSGNIEEVLKDSAMSESEKNAIRVIISKNDDRVRKISDEFRATQAVSQKDMDSLHSQLVGIVSSLTALELQLESAKEARFDATLQIRKLKGTLQDNLIKIVVLQSALNKIGASVDTLKISRDEALHPIKTDIRPIAADQTRLKAIFPTVLVFMIMVSGILMAASLVAFHRQNPGSLRDSLTPIHPAARLTALFATTAILLVAQTMGALAFAGVILGQSVIAGLPSAGVVVGGLIAVFSLLGMVLGFLFASEQAAVVAGAAASIGALVMSDALLPLESMPHAVALAASLNPFVLGSEAVRRALLYHTSLLSSIPKLVILGAYTMMLIVILACVYKER